MMLGRVVLPGFMRLVVRGALVRQFDRGQLSLRHSESRSGTDDDEYQDRKTAFHKILPHELPFYKYFGEPSPAVNLIPKGHG